MSDLMTAEHEAAVRDSEPKQLAAFLRNLSLGQPPHTRLRLRWAAFWLGRNDIAEIDALLDEWGAPTGDGQVTFATIGRLRAYRSDLIIEANRLRDAAEQGTKA